MVGDVGDWVWTLLRPYALVVLYDKLLWGLGDVVSGELFSGDLMLLCGLLGDVVFEFCDAELLVVVVEVPFEETDTAWMC